MPRPAFTTKKQLAKRISSPPKKKLADNPFSSTRAFSLVIYGPPGVGKTEFAAHFPNPSFLIDPREEGIYDLLDFRKCPKPVGVHTATTWEEAKDKIDEVIGEEKTSTLILDSLSGFENLCFIDHCDKYFEGDWTKEGFFAFQQGPKNAAKIDWPAFLAKLDEARAAMINVILIGHSTIKPFTNPEGPDFDRYIPAVDKALWDQTHRWAACEIFYNFEMEVTKEAKNKKAKVNTDANGRFLYTEQTPSFDAKNRWGLSPVIEAGGSGKEAYDNFVESYLKAKGD